MSNQTYSLTCKQCQTPFTSSRQDTKTCSPKCRTAHHRGQTPQPTDTLTAYEQLKALENNPPAEPHQAAEQAIALYKQLAQSIKEIEALQKRVKQVLTDLITETNQTTWATPAGKAYLPAPSIVVRYDTKELDQLLANRPELRQFIEPFRKEEERPGSLTIR